MNKSVGTFVSNRDWLRDEPEAEHSTQPRTTGLEGEVSPQGAERIHLMRASRRQLPQLRITG